MPTPHPDQLDQATINLVFALRDSLTHAPRRRAPSPAQLGLPANRGHVVELPSG